LYILSAPKLTIPKFDECPVGATELALAVLLNVSLEELDSLTVLIVDKESTRLELLLLSQPLKANVPIMIPAR